MPWASSTTRSSTSHHHRADPLAGRRHAGADHHRAGRNLDVDFGLCHPAAGRADGAAQEPIEAAKVDGCNPIQVFRHITLPFLMPFVYIAMTIRSLDVARAYDMVRIMTNGGPADGPSCFGRS